MKINYGLWWYEGKKRIHKNYSIEHVMDWGNQEDHLKFRDMVHSNNPNKHLTGYCPANEEEGK